MSAINETFTKGELINLIVASRDLEIRKGAAEKLYQQGRIDVLAELQKERDEPTGETP